MSERIAAEHRQQAQGVPQAWCADLCWRNATQQNDAPASGLDLSTTSDWRNLVLQPRILQCCVASRCQSAPIIDPWARPQALFGH
jgi:hypothetical protein